MNTRKLAVIGILGLLLSLSNLTFGEIVHASGVSQASFTTTRYDNHVTNIRVNSVRNSVQVIYDDNNIVSNGNCDDHRIWTAATGWVEDGHDLACIGIQDANSGDSATYAHYTNANFPLCGGVPTYDFMTATMPSPRRLEQAGI